jgi:hypothetical protein
MSEEETETREDDRSQGEDGGGEGSEAQEKAKEAAESREKAQEEMKELEEKDEVPKNLEDWPSDKGKYMTYGGQEGDHSYAEGPEQKLGPSELRRHSDGSIEISGEKVDDPDEYKGDPIPGGPTDPNAPEGPERSRERTKGDGGDDEGSDGDGDDDRGKDDQKQGDES